MEMPKQTFWPTQYFLRCLSGINFICHHVEGVNKIVLYIFSFIKFSLIPLLLVSLDTLTFWGVGGVGNSVDYEFRTSPEHSLAFLKRGFPPPPSASLSINCVPFSSHLPEICWPHLFLGKSLPILSQLWIYSFLFLHERTEVGLPSRILPIILNLTSFVKNIRGTSLSSPVGKTVLPMHGA